MIKWLKKKLSAWCGGYCAELPPVHIVQSTRPLEKVAWSLSYDAFLKPSQDIINEQAAEQLAKFIIEHNWMDVRIAHEDANTITNYYTMYVARREENDTNR